MCVRTGVSPRRKCDMGEVTLGGARIYVLASWITSCSVFYEDLVGDGRTLVVTW